MSQSAIQQAAAAIQNARQIVVLTGAGVSKESGVPTFRDAGTGLWARYDPMELATPQAFASNPKLVWDWYQHRREIGRVARPNPGHIALAQIQRRYPATRIITQNVDDLHEQGGAQDVIHLHGNIARSRCADNCRGKPTYIDLSTLTWDADAGPPTCPHCGAYLRPDVVWFGETLPEDALTKAVALSQACDLMLIVGTSGMVSPAANLPHYAAQAGATLIEVNPSNSMLTPLVDVKLDGPSGELLPQVVEALA